MRTVNELQRMGDAAKYPEGYHATDEEFLDVRLLALVFLACGLAGHAARFARQARYDAERAVFHQEMRAAPSS